VTSTRAYNPANAHAIISTRRLFINIHNLPSSLDTDSGCDRMTIYSLYIFDR
jgi:hypothetical protein